LYYFAVPDFTYTNCRHFLPLRRTVSWFIAGSQLREVCCY